MRMARLQKEKNGGTEVPPYVQYLGLGLLARSGQRYLLRTVRRVVGNRDVSVAHSSLGRREADLKLAGCARS